MDDLARACEIITEEGDWSERPETIETPLGTHGCHYNPHFPPESTDSEVWVVVGMSALPGGVFAEIEHGTYGNLQGFRYYPFR